MDLRRHVAVLWASAWIIVGSVVAGLLLGYLAGGLVPRTYEARATLYVGQSLTDPSLGYDGILASQVMAQSYAQLATTRPVMDRVVEELGLGMSGDELAQQVTTELEPQGTLLSIVARDADPTRVSLIANSVASQLQTLAPQVDGEAAADARARLAALDQSIAETQRRLLDLLAVASPSDDETAELAEVQQRLSSLSAARAVVAADIPGASPNTLTLVDPAGTTGSTVGLSRALIMAAAAAAAAALAVSLAYIRAAWRATSPAGRAAEDGSFAAPLRPPAAARAPKRSR